MMIHAIFNAIIGLLIDCACNILWNVNLCVSVDAQEAYIHLNYETAQPHTVGSIYRPTAPATLLHNRSCLYGVEQFSLQC